MCSKQNWCIYRRYFRLATLGHPRGTKRGYKKKYGRKRFTIFVTNMGVSVYLCLFFFFYFQQNHTLYIQYYMIVQKGTNPVQGYLFLWKLNSIHIIMHCQFFKNSADYHSSSFLIFNWWITWWFNAFAGRISQYSESFVIFRVSVHQ